MAQYLPDNIDWPAYERDTEVQFKVKPAGAFANALKARFRPADGPRCPSMISTKMRGDLQFRPGEVTAWAGYSGHRKSMFVGQMVLDLCSQGHRSLVCSMEMLPEETLGRMAQQALARPDPSPRMLDDFGRWTDGRLWLFDHMGRIAPKQMMAVCRYFAEEVKGGHVVIDSMMMVCASEESLDEQKQLVTDLVRAAQELRIHVHLLAHCRKPQTGDGKPPTKYDLRGTAAITDQAANVVTIWANKPKQAKLEQDPNDASAAEEPDALVTVEKQRNGRWEGRVKLWFAEGSLRFTDRRMEFPEPYAFGGVL